MSNPAAVANSTGAAASSSLAEWAQRYSVETTPLGRGSFASVSLWCRQALGYVGWLVCFPRCGVPGCYLANSFCVY